MAQLMRMNVRRVNALDEHETIGIEAKQGPGYQKPCLAATQVISLESKAPQAHWKHNLCATEARFCLWKTSLRVMQAHFACGFRTGTMYDYQC